MRSVVATCGLALACGLLSVPDPALAQDPAERVAAGYTYRTYCASCHGVMGKGDGPLAQSLRFVPPDLTRLAKNNGGKYPAELVARIVDGREPVDGHGGPDMPVWGDAFKNADTGFDDEKVKAKIQAVVSYVKTLQE